MNELNLKNTKVTEKDILEVFKKGGIPEAKVNDLSIYQKALTSKTYVNDIQYSLFKDLFKLKKDVVDFQPESNERFEFFGDSVINGTICEYLFRRFRNKDEGFLTLLKTKIVSKKYLPKFTKFVGLEKFVLISKHMEILNGRDQDSLLEDTFEAFLCAMKLDLGDELGYRLCKKFIIYILERNINFSKMAFNNRNYKDRMIKIGQKEGGKLKFVKRAEIGRAATRYYYVQVNYNGRWLATGFAPLLKDAEHQAALRTMIQLGYITDDELKVSKTYM